MFDILARQTLKQTSYFNAKVTFINIHALMSVCECEDRRCIGWKITTTSI